MPFLFGNCITIFSLLIFGNAGVFCDGCGCTECKICLCLYSKLGTMSEINGVLVKILTCVEIRGAVSRLYTCRYLDLQITSNRKK